MKKRVFIPASVLIIGALIALDQWTKVLAETRLQGRGIIKVLGDVVILVFAQNTGAFLSMGAKLPEVLRVIVLIVFPAILLCAALAYFYIKAKPSLRNLAIISLLAAGGFGNLIDRIFKGQVTDFLNFGIGKLRTGVMNAADLYILALVIILVLKMFIGKQEAPPTEEVGPSETPK